VTLDGYGHPELNAAQCLKLARWLIARARDIQERARG
jgi:hypothetical protein